MSLSCLIQPSGTIVSESHSRVRQYRISRKTDAVISTLKARPLGMQSFPIFRRSDAFHAFTGLWRSSTLDAMGMPSFDLFPMVLEAINSTPLRKSSRGISVAVMLESSFSTSESSFSGFSLKSKKAIYLAQEEAKRLGQSQVGPKEILLGLISEGTGIAARVLNSMDTNLKVARKYVRRNSQHEFVSVEVVPFNAMAMRALDFIAEEACRSFHNYARTEHLLLGLSRMENRRVKDVLKSLGVDPCEIREKVSQVLAEEGIEVSGKAPVEQSENSDNDSNKIKLAKECLKQQVEELTELEAFISNYKLGSSGLNVMPADAIKDIDPGQVNDCLSSSGFDTLLTPFYWHFGNNVYSHEYLSYFIERDKVFKLLSLLPGRISYTEGVPLSQFFHCCPYAKIIFDDMIKFFPEDFQKRVYWLDNIPADCAINFYYEVYADSILKCTLRVYHGSRKPKDPFFVSYLVERKVDDNGGYSYSEFLVHIHRQVPTKNEKDCVTSD